MEHIQIIYQLVIVLLYSFFITFWSVPYVMAKLHKYGYKVDDKYKIGRVRIPTMGGISMLIGIFVSLALTQILLNTQELSALFIFYFVVVAYGLYGVVDDLFHFRKRYDKILALLIISFPIASLIEHTTVNIGFMRLEIGVFYSLFIIPIYVMVIANLVNLHAGYNGLTQGLSLIILFTLGIQSYLLHGLTYLLYLMPLLGAVLGFFPFTRYPARILPGNVGDLIVGAGIGAFIVINNMLWFGIFIFIPHIINFIMDTWTLVIRKRPDVKFGTVRSDGTIAPPPTMIYKSLKFWIVSNMRLTEPQATRLLYVITAMFCVVGVVLFS